MDRPSPSSIHRFWLAARASPFLVPLTASWSVSSVSTEVTTSFCVARTGPKRSSSIVIRPWRTVSSTLDWSPEKIPLYKIHGKIQWCLWGSVRHQANILSQKYIDIARNLQSRSVPDDIRQLREGLESLRNRRRHDPGLFQSDIGVSLTEQSTSWPILGWSEVCSPVGLLAPAIRCTARGVESSVRCSR